MTPARERVLLYGFGDASELASRVRALGYEVVAEREPRAAAAQIAHGGESLRVVLLPSDFALPQRAGELDHLLRAAGAFGLGFVAVGARPDAPEGRAALGARGARLCLGSPFHDRELRFVLNRAAFAPRGLVTDSDHAEGRRELRVPTDLTARVHIGGREKPALVYSLSVAGCFLETRRPSLVGGALEVVLALPDAELHLGGRVVLTNVPGNLQRPSLPCGMGVEFVRLVPDARQALEAYVRERARAYEL